jgi:prepilin-type N-terminal cleavage/methylation domain-containing protein
MKRFPSPASLGGFTLVEILVVVVVIAALTACGFATVKSMRDQAHMSACASNLRNIGLGLQMFADDNLGSYPDTTHSKSADKAWIYQLATYLGEFDEVRICPADPKASQRLKNKASSYILNNAVFAAEIDEMAEEPSRAFNKPSLLPDPSNTILVFTIADRKPPFPGEDHTHSELWTNWQMLVRDISPDRHKRRNSGDFTKGASNYLYADSSVRNHTALEIKGKITSGKNIGLVSGAGH